MKCTVFTAFGGLALLASAVSTPALAKEGTDTGFSAEETAAINELFGDMFGEVFGDADPLSAEQEARVPAAMLVVSKLFPKGTYARMMEESMRPMMEGMMGGLAGNPRLSVAQLSGLNPLDLTDLDEERLAKAANLLDPHAEQRSAASTEMMLTLITDLVADIEPAYRAGLARAYATRFTNEELIDLNAYFETEVGRKYAGESIMIFADPQVMATMNEMIPAMMERTPAMMTDLAAIEEEFPAGRTFSALSASEQARLAALLGVSEEDLAASEPDPSSIDSF